MTEEEHQVFYEALARGGKIAHHYINTDSPTIVAQWIHHFAEETVGLIFGTPDDSPEEILGDKSSMG